MRVFFDIDTQMDFVFPAGALYSPGAGRLIPGVAALNRLAAAHGIPVVSSVCAHPEDAAEFRDWAPHCVAGSFGQRKPSATILTEGRQIFVRKNQLDLFGNPEVPGLLDSLGTDECYVYGVFLEYCVDCALTGLLQRGHNVCLVTDATMPVSEEAGRRVLGAFGAAGGILVTADQIPMRLAS